MDASQELVGDGEAVETKHVQGAIPVEVAEGGAGGIALCVGQAEWLVQVELSSVVAQNPVRRAKIDQENVQVAIGIEIQEGAADRLHSGADEPALVGKEAIPLVVIQDCRLVGKAGDEQVRPAIPIVVAERRSVGRSFVGNTRLDRPIREGYRGMRKDGTQNEDQKDHAACGAAH